MTIRNYVIPTREIDLPIQYELNALGAYGITRELAIDCVVNELVNEESDGYDEIESLVVEVIDEQWHQQSIDGSFTEPLPEAEQEFKRAKPVIASLCRKINDYIRPYLVDVSEREAHQPHPLQFQVRGSIGQDIILKVI
mgnify:CR=1 FL=1